MKEVGSIMFTGKTLEERIHAWIKDENPMNLLYHFCLILDTETFQIIHQGIRNKINMDFDVYINKMEYKNN